MTRLTLLLMLCFVLNGLPVSADDSFALYFFRHAEKMKLPKGNPDLTEKGHQRAKALASHFNTLELDVIYSSDYQRTLNTASPVADCQKKTVELYDPRQLQVFANELLTKKQNALIVGHSNTTPELVSLVGGKPLYLTEADYGDLTILRINGKEIATSHIKIEPNSK